MISVNATEFKNNLGQYLVKVYREPVVVNKMGRPSAVLLSYEEYLKLTEVQDKDVATLYGAEKEQALQKIRHEMRKLKQKEKHFVTDVGRDSGAGAEDDK